MSYKVILFFYSCRFGKNDDVIVYREEQSLPVKRNLHVDQWKRQPKKTAMV